VPSQTHAAVPTETPATELPEVTVTEPTMEAPIPSESTPETVPDNESTTDKTIIASGKWDGGPVRWSVTSDGTLTISGNRSIQGVATHQTYIWKQYSDIITRIVVEDGITSIPQKAFSEMPNVTSIYLSRTLEKIEPEAFYKCTALEAVTIPAQVTEIPEYAFYGCSNLRELRFASDSRIHTIGQYAFSGTGITEFSSPPSLYEILSDAFSDCRLLQTVILKGGIEQVYYNAFRDCTRLKHIVLGESITNGGRPFGGCSAIETIEVYSEASVCFEEYTALKSITFKENARTICSSGFRGCTALSEVNLDAPIVTIESHAFFDCRSLTSIKLPNTVRNIEIYAFAYTGITRIVIPESVICMKGNVFIGSGLKEIVFQGDIPDFENNTFNGVTATVYYPADNITWMEEKLKDYGGNLTWIPQ